MFGTDDSRFLAEFWNHTQRDYEVMFVWALCGHKTRWSASPGPQLCASVNRLLGVWSVSAAPVGLWMREPTLGRAAVSKRYAVAAGSWRLLPVR